ncbi:MAG: ABC transporter ATP-binding protein, partial [Erysipelotrichaceae bacterium]|nr:ABC transporter ATP-binding protein [Erysipelotrichaceae bacterium]
TQKNILLGPEITKELTSDNYIRMDSLLKNYGLDGFKKSKPNQLSGGMRQRVVIAIALACNPDILICDEPTTALDVTIQAKILELIKKLQEEHNISVIYITHDLGVVAKVADYVDVMYAGRIIEKGDVNEIFYDPRHPYTWGLLASMPDTDTDSTRLFAIPGTPPNLLERIQGDAFAPRNPYALAIDYKAEPPMYNVGGKHRVASWLCDPRAPKVEMPEQLKDRLKKMKEEDERYAGN